MSARLIRAMESASIFQDPINVFVILVMSYAMDAVKVIRSPVVPFSQFNRLISQF